MHSFLNNRKKKIYPEIEKVSLGSKHGWESSAMWSVLLNLGNRKDQLWEKREGNNVKAAVLNGNTDWSFYIKTGVA